MKEQLQELSVNPKIAGVVSVMTTSTGTATWMEWIPDDIGKLATLLGAILSMVLIYTHLRRHRLEARRMELDLEIIKRKEDERLQRVKHRMQHGEPVRRVDDR